MYQNFQCKAKKVKVFHKQNKIHNARLYNSQLLQITKKKKIPLGKEVTINWMQKMSSAKVLSMAVFHNNIPWCKIRQWCDLSSMQ